MKNWIINRYNGIVFGRTAIGEYLNSFYNLRLFLKYRFSSGKFKEKDNLKAFLIKQYHIVEKGLALPLPRENFGIPKIKLLLAKTARFEEVYGFDEDVSTPVRNTIREYLKCNPNLESVDAYLQKSLVDFINNGESEDASGGTKSILKAELNNFTNIDYRNFVLSRSSVRGFQNVKVDRNDIKNAIDIARHTPSVCNRQNWKLHYYDDSALKTELLNLQLWQWWIYREYSGIIHCDFKFKRIYKNGAKPSFCGWWAYIHESCFGLASFRNWLLLFKHLFSLHKRNKNQKIAGIPENERLIMMIGIGYWKDDFKVAFSKKKNVDDILIIH